MIIPNRIRLSKTVTSKFQTIKNRTGVTPNILSRIALMKALESEATIDNAGVGDADGQEISRDVMFGEYVHVYNLLLSQFISESKSGQHPTEIISALIEIGAHKMGHTKRLSDLL